MKAQFDTSYGHRFTIGTFPEAPPNDPADHVALTVSARGAAINAPLTKSEARAIASALMGAAAEL
jgi:hypothetical protein